MKYKIGQIVIVKKLQPLNNLINIGDEGKIVSFRDGLIGVEFFHYINGHSCRDKGRSEYCWWFKPDELEIVNENNEIVTVSFSKEDALNNLLMKYPNLSKHFNV